MGSELFKVNVGSSEFTVYDNKGLYDAYADGSLAYGELHKGHEKWNKDLEEIIKAIRVHEKKKVSEGIVKAKESSESAGFNLFADLPKVDFSTRLYVGIILKLRELPISKTEYINQAIIEKLERDAL